MSPWLVFAVLTVLAVALVVTPLLRRHARQRNAAEFDVEVYRDQLSEADRDAERGVLSPDEAEAAKAEIARRLLRAAEDTGAEAREPKGALRWGPAVGVIVAIPVITLGSYALIGNPDLRDKPFAARTDVRPAQTATTEAPHAGLPNTMEEAVTELARRMKENPDRLDGWLLLGRSYMSLERFTDAADAYGRAVALASDRGDISASHGEALVAANNGTVTPEAAKAFARALERNPFDPKSLYYAGLQRAQQGDLKAAMRAWVDLVAISPANAPWLPTVRDHIARAAKEAGIDPDTAASMTDSKSAVEQSRIREKSEQLAARLADEPDDETGWRALAQSYRVLGENAKAKEAEDTAEALADAARQAQERKLALSGGPVPPQDEARIRTMVQSLAVRLQAEPDDEQGWRMLARSYRVLGEPEKAAEAQAKADALAARGPTAVAPAPRAPAASPPPSSPQGQPLQGVGPDDQARIRTMVQRLANRLANNPNDEQGWRMLARSYGVLGEPEKAREAQAKADALAAKRGTEAPQPPARSPAAAPPQGQNLQGFAPDDQARIRTMVKRLADRLAQNPDDEQGWRMLARSYQVLGQPDKAAEALAKADALAAKKDGN